MATSNVWSFASFAQISISTPSSMFSTLIVGCSFCRRSASMVTTASSADAPPSACPIIDFVPFIFTCPTSSPNTPLTALYSAISPAGVDVACAFTYPTSAAVTPASRIARSMHSWTPRPSFLGSVIWCASQVKAPPRYSARTVAPRAFARARDSRTRRPAPSPRTKPSRDLSHGREAEAGAAVLVERARQAMKPPRVSSVQLASQLPASMTSASPRMMCWAALWIAKFPVAHAVEME
mmetsp:Transcript_11170/g.29431  ORF Transcript_11170/g.29431 Transcript_11170/m.29431 type:complete len:237 (-) Transcript_11170:682-1392(-)